MATRLVRLLSDIHYCYQCFDWVVGEKWEPHCQAHLDASTSKRCGTATYCHTLVHPGSCPFCVGDISLPASERLKPWSRDHKLWIHVNEEHLVDCQWPLECPHPLCDTTHEDVASFQFHLMDVHRFCRSQPGKLPKSIRQPPPNEKKLLDKGAHEVRPCRKRKPTSSSAALEWRPLQTFDSTTATPEKRLSYRPPKRKRQSPPTQTICPEVIVIDDDVSDDHVTQGVVKSIMLSPPSPLSSEDDFKSTGLEGGPFPSYCAAPNETIYSLEPEGFDDDSSLDTLFDQYLRSPSPSPPPSPDDAASESSGATLIGADRDQSRGSEGPYTETLKGRGPKSASESEGVLDQEDTCYVKNGPRIRLRVSQPKITLRLRLQDTSQPGKKDKKGSKRETKKKGIQLKGKRGKRQRKPIRRM
jgi:hypothetical protein